MDQKQRQMVESNHNLIYYMLNREHLPVDDYYDVAAIGLCKAAMSYKPEAGPFSTYACRCILYELTVDSRWRDRKKRQADKGVLHYNTHTDEGSEMLDLMSNNVDPEREAVDRCYAEYVLSKLKPMEADIFRMMAGQYTLTEIADYYCLSRQRITAIIYQARGKLTRYGIRREAAQ